MAAGSSSRASGCLWPATTILGLSASTCSTLAIHCIRCSWSVDAVVGDVAGDDGVQARDVVLISETEVAGHVASPSPIGAISPSIGLYGTTNTSRHSGLDMPAPFTHGVSSRAGRARIRQCTV